MKPQRSTVLDLLAPGSVPTDADLDRLAKTMGARSSSDYILKDLIPRLHEEVLCHLRRAKTTEELWMAKGALKTIDDIETHVKYTSKEPKL